MIHEPQPQQRTVKTSMSRQERLIICCVCLAAFTFQFEAFLINVALPDMAAELHATSTEISFTVLVYLLATTIALIPAGKLGDRFGLRRTFLTGCALAAAGTLLCGLSTELPVLLAFRFIQGLGIGSIVANAYAMIPKWISQEHAGRGYGLLSLGAGVGMVAGLPVGGALSFALSWHWIFLATTPLFLALFWLGWKVLPIESRPPQLGLKLDWIGLFILGWTLSFFVLAVSLGAELGWTSTPILSLFLLTVFLIVVLVARKNRQSSLFSAAIFSSPGLMPGLCVLFIFAIAVGGVRFLLPFYLQLSCGLSALLSSILLLSYPISFAPAGIVAGRQADRVGSHWLVSSACILVALLCSLFAWLSEELGIWFFILFVLGLGFANGMFFAPTNRFCISNVPDQLKGETSALLPVALNMGTLIGVSLFETIFTIHVPKGDMLVLGDTRPTDHMLALINHGFVDAFELAALLLLAAGLFAWITLRPARCA